MPWTQWGGPHRNFQTDAPALKETWPASGPPVVWKRQLGGDGYSAPAVEAEAGARGHILSSIAASVFAVTIRFVSAAWKRAIEEMSLKDLAAYWGMAAIVLVPIALSLIDP